MRQCRILLAEDNPDVRSYLQEILKERDHIVAQACDGVEALDVLKALGGTADLLITDIKMPRMDGFALARAVAEISPTIPVLFMSGWSDPLDGPEWQGPRYAFLPKPFLPEALMNSIEQLLVRSMAKTAHG